MTTGARPRRSGLQAKAVRASRSELSRFQHSSWEAKSIRGESALLASVELFFGRIALRKQRLTFLQHLQWKQTSQVGPEWNSRRSSLLPAPSTHMTPKSGLDSLDQLTYSIQLPAAKLLAKPGSFDTPDPKTNESKVRPVTATKVPLMLLLVPLEASNMSEVPVDLSAACERGIEWKSRKHQAASPTA